MSNPQGTAGRVVEATGALDVGLDGRIVRADAGACAILGLGERELAGRRVTEFVQPDDAPGDQRYVRPDGEMAWLLVDAAVADPHGGDPQHFVVRLRDVTAARELAAAARDAHAAAVRAVEGSWVIDADGRTTAVSPSAAEMLGTSPDALIGRPIAEFVAPEDRDVLTAALDRRRAGMRESYELRWDRPAGGRAHVLVSAAPLHDADGRYAGSFALLTDVSERRREEERVRRHARQQQAVADLGAVALRSADLASLYDLAVRTVADVLAADAVSLLELREAGDLALVAGHGLPAADSPEDERVPASDVQLAWLATGKPYVIADWQAPDAPSFRRGVFAREARASVAVPVTGRRPHGLVGASRRTPWHPQEDELAFLRAVAHVLAGAIERAQAEDEARRRVLQDPLTGLPNRTLALDRLAHALERAERGEGAVGVVVVDVDRFGEINEALGFEAGDEVLRTVASRLRAAVRPADTIARLSGDDFAVLCEDVDEEEAVAVAERLLAAVRLPIEVAGEQLVPGLSAGVTVTRGRPRPEDLLRDAEIAMARAERAGGDRVELYGPEARERALGRQRLERELRRAVGGGELFLVHQPVVGVEDGRIAGVEALVRWRHPERGVVPPADFIGLAEATGIIRDLGAWVLRTACAEVAARSNGRRLTCHVNLSPRQVADAALPGIVEEALAAAGLPAEQLVLELTESSLMEAGDEPVAVLDAVRELGVRLVLDDFGTGYSSLARLRHLRLDGLKIDRAFIAALDGDEPVDALLVAGIVDLGRALGLTVVAEGVETAEQLRRLRAAGCRYAQGFLLARPQPAEDLGALLARTSLLPAA